MRRFILFGIICLFFLISCWVGRGLEDLVKTNIITKGFYTYSEVEGIQCGKLYICQDDSMDLLAFGEYIYLDDVFDVSTFIKDNNIQIVSIDNIDNQNLVVYNLYCKNLKRVRILDNKKINIQLAVCNNYIKLGYPSIYDSF